MKYTIKTIGGKILISKDASSLEDCLEQEVKEGADLRGANLSGANLRGAYLSGAYLSGAYLRGADLRGAYLSDANLSGAYLSDANLSGAYLSDAYLSDANLSGANLSGANLRGAYLSGAYLSGADLSGANLSGANLRGANLSGAKGINKYLTTPMYMLLDQTNPIRAYKVVNSSNTGIYNPGIIYEIDKQIEVDKWNSNEIDSCGAGINLASLDWCLREWQEGYKILLCEFTREDIVCIPIGSDGKFRVKKCTPIKELDLGEYSIDKKGD